MIEAAIRALVRGVRRVVGPVAAAVGARTDAAVERWRRRTSERRRTVYLVAFLIVWLGGGGWLLSLWLGDEAPEPSTAAVSSDVPGPRLGGGNIRSDPGAGAEPPRRGTEPATGDDAPAPGDDLQRRDGVEGRLARWAATRYEGWETVSVQRDDTREGHWLVLGRTADMPRNRVGVLTVRVSPDGEIELVEEQLS